MEKLDDSPEVLLNLILNIIEQCLLEEILLVME